MAAFVLNANSKLSEGPRTSEAELVEPSDSLYYSQKLNNRFIAVEHNFKSPPFIAIKFLRARARQRQASPSLA
jgi:hypothetical protein